MTFPNNSVIPASGWNKQNIYLSIVLKSRYEVCLQEDDQNICVGTNLDEQPSYVITPESLARRSKWRSREVRTRLEGLSCEAKKKNLKRENIFLCEKSTFGDLKSILGDIFLKNGGSL